MCTWSSGLASYFGEISKNTEGASQQEGALEIPE